jgi:hypothetical protein
VATAAAVRSPRTTLHTRGNWPPREDRIPSAIWLAILWAGMIAGFGTDLSRFAHENPPAPKILYVHATVFTIWMLLLTTQVLGVLGGRISFHRKLGWFLVGWACLMGVLGPWAVMASDAVNLNTPANGLPTQFLSVNFLDVGGFLVLLAWGIALRKNPAAHKRMMILSSVSLADPGFNRFIGYLMPAEPQSATVFFFYVFYGNVLLIALMAAWDWYSGRLIRSFVIGAAGLLAAEYVASFLFFWKPWQQLTLEWVTAWAKHFA